MRRITNYLFLAIILVVFFASCGESADKSKQQNTTNSFNDKKRLEDINQYLTEKDKDIIENYIRRQGWHMQLSPDGYFYEIYDEGTPPKAIEGSEVEYECTISLLDGSVAYQPGELKNFLVDRSEEISGLHLAIKHLGKGGRAKFIFPPQLAYGLQGDMDKIPPRSVVIYDVKVIDIK